ncbi:MAG: class I SAM-dependent methyltransferase [Trueperaceae bacterium]|nr:class I SAM-dependent methyltransferase [Trueperaceae bacterium]
MSATDGIIAGYVEFLRRYSKTLDLMSPQGLQQVDRLVADARAYADSITTHVNKTEPTVVDVGSGAGLPGVVIAILLQDARVYLVERRRRRAAFLELVTSRLSISNVTVVNADVRHLKDVCADAVTAQAVSGLAAVASLTRHLHCDPCLLVSRRGPGWEGELAELNALVARTVSGQSNEGQDEPAISPSGTAILARAETTPAVAVLGVEPLEQRGSLVALRLAGGPACRSSA